MSTAGAERAQRHVRKAIRNGLLPPITNETRCVDCGLPAKCYEHRDYNRPLDVEPVCHRCNIARGSAAPYTLSQSKMVRKNFFFPSQLLKRLAMAKAQTGTPISELIRRAVEDYLRKEQK